MAKDVRVRSVDLNAPTWPSSILVELRMFTVERRFAKVGTVVTELYSDLLRSGEPLRAGTWWVRLVPDNTSSGQMSGVPMAVNGDGGEICPVPFDPSVLDLPDADRRLAVLDWVHDTMLRLARSLGWDEAPLRAVHQGCLDAGLRLDLVSAPKSSRDRKHRAWVSFTIDGEGDGWTRLHVAGPSGETSTQPAYSYPTVKSGRRTLRTLRWLDSGTAAYRPWIYPDEPPEPSWTDRLVTLTTDGTAGERPFAESADAGGLG